VKYVDRHLFFDKVKTFGIDCSCLYEIPKNDLVDDMKLWPPVTFPESRCVLLPHRHSGRPLGKSWKHTTLWFNSEWVKPLQALQRNSGYDSHDATSPSSFPILPPTSALPLFNEGLGISPWENCWIKDVCRYVLEHFGGLMRSIIFHWNKKVNSPPHFLIFCRPRISVTHFAWPGVPLTPLVAVDHVEG